MSHEQPQPDYRQTLHQAVVETAQGMVAGSLGVVEATRRFMELAAELDALDDEDFLYFIELDSRSDGFPSARTSVDCSFATTAGLIPAGPSTP